LKRLLVALLALAGCRTEAPPTAVEQAAKATPPRIATNTSFDISAAAKPVVRRACFQCHAQANPYGVYHAGVEIHAGTPWTMVIPGANADPQMIMDALADGRAPAHRPLTGGEMDTLMLWLMSEPINCVTVNTTVPSTFTWDQETHETGMTRGTSQGGWQPHAYTAFAVEDMILPDLYLESSFTEHSGHSATLFHESVYSFNTLRADRYSAVQWGCSCASDSFSHSDDATNYVMPAGVEWNGRLKNTHMHGYFIPDKRFRVGMHVQEDREGPDRLTRRDSREYVALQIEGGSTQKIGLQRKTRTFTSNYTKSDNEIETVGAWDTYGRPDDFVADSDSGYTLTDSGFYGPNSGNMFGDAYYWYEFYSWSDGTDMHYRGELWTDNPRENELAVKMAWVGAIWENHDEAFGGFFVNGWYERNSTSKFNRIAKTHVTASNMYGAGGHPAGECHLCELDRKGDMP
jgi:hypothetical protein